MCDSTFVEILANLDSINERAPRISVRDENLEAHKRNILSVLADRLSNEYTAAELEDYLRSEIASRSGSPRETNYDYSEDHIRFLGCQGSRSIPKLAESTRAQILKRCKELSSNRTDILKLRLRRSCSSLPRHDDSPQSPNRASLKTRRSAGVKKNMLKSERKPKRRSRGHRTVSFVSCSNATYAVVR